MTGEQKIDLVEKTVKECGENVDVKFMICSRLLRELAKTQTVNRQVLSDTADDLYDWQLEREPYD